MLQLPVTLRITGQDMAFDSLGLSALIAQEIDGDFGKIRHLCVEIWPPHADRPTDMLYTWNHVRKLRDTLKRFARIQKLSLNFIDSKVFDWTEKGKLRSRLPSRTTENDNDVAALLELFATLTNVTEAFTAFPRSLIPILENHTLRRYAAKIRQIMKGLQAPAISPTFLENLEWESLELDFKNSTAGWAMFKLARMTKGGEHKISEEEYDSVVRRWPYFETLTRWEDEKFLGKWHHVERDPTVERRNS